MMQCIEGHDIVFTLFISIDRPNDSNLQLMDENKILFHHQNQLKDVKER
jgi:hypothetical protein